MKGAPKYREGVKGITPYVCAAPGNGARAGGPCAEPWPCAAHPEGPRAIDPRTRFCTPRSILDPLERELGPITFDPCGDPFSVVNAEQTIMLPDHEAELIAAAGGEPAGPWSDYGIILGDGLASAWPADGFTFGNPPYGRRTSKAWADRLERHGAFCENQVVLVNASVGSRWWQPYWSADLICFLFGRVKHGGIGEAGKGSFDSVLAYWGDNAEGFNRACSKLGHVTDPAPYGREARDPDAFAQSMAREDAERMTINDDGSEYEEP